MGLLSSSPGLGQPWRGPLLCLQSGSRRACARLAEGGLPWDCPLQGVPDLLAGSWACVCRMLLVKTSLRFRRWIRTHPLMGGVGNRTAKGADRGEGCRLVSSSRCITWYQCRFPSASESGLQTFTIHFNVAKYNFKNHVKVKVCWNEQVKTLRA